MFTKEVLDHFTHPRNLGDLESPTVVGQGGDPDCGDHIELQLRLENERIVAVAARVYGCPFAIATTSAFTELIAGKTLDEALEVTDAEVDRVLGGLPEAKRHCSLLGPEALRRAASAYILQMICTPCELNNDHH